MMVGILKVELDKARRLGWTWLAIAGMNAFSAAMLVIFVILYLKSTALDDAAELSLAMARQAGAILYFVFVTETWVFSLLGFVFLGFFIGEIFGREFDSGAIGLTFMAPCTRLHVFFAKLLTVLTVYLVALLLNLCIQAATVLLFSRVHEVFLRLVEPAVLVKLLLATVLIDLSWICLLVLASTLSRGVASTLAYTMILYFGLLLVDVVVWLGGQFEFLEQSVIRIGAFTFTNSCRILQSNEVARHFMGGHGADAFPLEFGLLGLNVAYTVTFVLGGYFVFSRREL